LRGVVVTCRDGGEETIQGDCVGGMAGFGRSEKCTSTERTEGAALLVDYLICGTLLDSSLDSNDVRLVPKKRAVSVSDTSTLCIDC
jgi:hypothetical protein